MEDTKEVKETMWGTWIIVTSFALILIVVGLWFAFDRDAKMGKVNTGTTTPVTNIYLIAYQKTIGTNPVAVIGNRVATGTKVTAIDINALVASIVGKDTNSQVVILNVIKLDQ